MENTEKKERNTKQARTKRNGRNKLTIEVRRFQNLIEILKDRRKVLTLSFTIFAIGILLFIGITMIVLSIKRLYPYNDITTNAMGTTTLRSENKDVSYFLLNSAELWANSGIKVKKGQTITIKSSGKKHSAVHHLIKDAHTNAPGLRDPWVGAEGFPESFDTRDPRDGQRARYRIFPNTNQDILLMQIVSKGNPSDKPFGLVYNDEEQEFQHENNETHFFVVGNRMDNIHIEADGVLYFAINDIVLEDETIIKMLYECAGKEIPNELRNIMKNANKFREDNETTYDELEKQYYSIRNKIEQSLNDTSIVSNSLKEKELDSLRARLNDICTSSLRLYVAFLTTFDITEEELNNHKEGKEYGKFHFGNGYGINNDKIELYGYYMKSYKEAWYEDNVGSFLILVETKND